MICPGLVRPLYDLPVSLWLERNPIDQEFYYGPQASSGSPVVWYRRLLDCRTLLRVQPFGLVNLEPQLGCLELKSPLFTNL